MRKALVIFFLTCMALIQSKAEEISLPKLDPELKNLINNPEIFADFSLFNESKIRIPGSRGLLFNEARIRNSADPRIKATAANNLGWIWWKKNDKEKSISYFNQAADFFKAENNLSGAALVMAEAGYLLRLGKNYDLSLNYFDQCLSLAKEDLPLRAFVHSEKGRLFDETGKPARSIEALRQALGHHEKSGNVRQTIRIKIKLSKQYIITGDEVQAGNFLASSLQQLASSKDETSRSVVLSYLGILKFRNHHFEKALSYFQQSLSIRPDPEVLKLVRETYLKLLSSSEVSNNAQKQEYYSKMYYQYRDSVQKLAALSASDSIREPRESLSKLLVPYTASKLQKLNDKQLEFDKKATAAELQRLKAEDALLKLNKEKAIGESEVHERENRINQLQKEMAEQELALSRKELKEVQQKQLINILVVFFLFAALLAFLLYSRYRQKKYSHENLNEAFEQLSKAHEQLKSTQDQLIHSEKMASLGQLTAGIAHEIKNPLNFVNNFSEVSIDLLEELEKSHREEEHKSIIGDLRQNLSKIIHHGKRADNIVRGMLLHSRDGSHEKQVSDVNQVVEEFVQLAYHSMRAKDSGFNSEVEIILDPNIPKVNIVPQDISRVLLNIFTNAFYAVDEKKKKSDSPSYQPRVSVNTFSENNHISISVTDNGNGIPAHLLEKIFVPFFTTKPAGDGTGLGLSISYDIVTKGHHGELKVESKAGEYTRFLINLPVS